jgi:hypothetical protein
MRYAFTLGLALLAAAGCTKKPASPETAITNPAPPRTAIATPVAPQPATQAKEPELKDPTPPDKLIPQDIASIEKRRAERLRWNLDTLVGAYEKVGKKNPKWDQQARAALDLSARMFSFQIDPSVYWVDIAKPARAAIDAGCDDPLVHFFYARSQPLSDGDLIRQYRVAAKAFVTSRYPAFRRAMGLMISLPDERKTGPEGDAYKKESRAAFDAALALLPESVATDQRNEFWDARWHDTCKKLISSNRWLGMSGPAAYEKVDAQLAKIPKLKAFRLRFRGWFWFAYGWEARTHAFAPNVPPGGFETLEECLAEAKKAYEEAWAIEPGVSENAEMLMEIDKAIGGDRATMERWFDRAMKADGDNRGACWSKLDWLDPKWHGTAEEMLAFGRACRDTKNSRTGITLLVADAHLRMAAMVGEDQIKYLSSPDVWADIHTVYDEYLKHHPTDEIARSKYATFCYLSNHYREAEVQYVALGDRLTQWPEYPFVPLVELKQNRERTARIVMGKAGSIQFPGWHFLASTEDDFEWRVLAPAHLEKQMKPGILGAAESHSWSCTNEGITYTIRVQALPDKLQKNPPDNILDAARPELNKDRGAEPSNLRATILAARPAQEYDIDLPRPQPMQVRVKTIVIGNWLYELSVTGQKTDVTGRNANEFFDSFAYQPKAK